MNRKNTILIAILINAGLLTILLVAALATQEETVPSSFMAEIEKPLFGDAADLAMRQPTPQLLPPKEISLPLPETVQSPEVQVASVVPEPVVVHQVPQIVSEPVVAVSAPASVAVAAPAFLEVAVKKGDNLEKIAKAHKTTVDDLIKFNQLPSSFLRVGQVLKIPAEKTLAAAPKPKPAAPAPEKKEAGPEYYIVKVGDNPWTIAMKHHLKVDDLLKMNGLNEERARKLKPGDRLRTR